VVELAKPKTDIAVEERLACRKLLLRLDATVIFL
jgi:hypothetical protein